MQRLRNRQAEQAEEELTLTPRINHNSRHMALSLASRAAQHDPHMLSLIQSQPQGWVLADRPAPASRPALPGVQSLVLLAALPPKLLLSSGLVTT